MTPPPGQRLLLLLVLCYDDDDDGDDDGSGCVYILVLYEFSHLYHKDRRASTDRHTCLQDSRPQ